MLRGLQTHFTGGLIGKERCERIAEIGVQIGRIDGQGQPAQMIADQCGELADVGIQQYVTGDSAAQVATLPKGIYGFEYLNEPDGQAFTLTITWRAYGMWPSSANCIATDSYGPTVTNLIRTKVLALRRGATRHRVHRGVCPLPGQHEGRGPSLRRQQHRDQPAPGLSQPGARSPRHAPRARLFRPWGVSETGWASVRHYDRRDGGPQLGVGLEVLGAHDGVVLIIYQIHDGPGDDHIEQLWPVPLRWTLKDAVATTFRV